MVNRVLTEGTVMGEYHGHEFDDGLAAAAPSWWALLEQSTDPEQPDRIDEAVKLGAPAFEADKARRVRRQNLNEAERKRSVEDAWFEPPAVPNVPGAAGVSAKGATSSPEPRAAPAEPPPSSAPGVGAPSDLPPSSVASSPTVVVSAVIARRNRIRAEAAKPVVEVGSVVDLLDEARKRATATAAKVADGIIISSGSVGAAKQVDPLFYDPAQPSVEDDEYVEPEDAEPEVGDDSDDGDVDDELAETGEELDVQLWRVELALAVVRPAGMAQVDGVGGLLWRLTGGKEKGWECWSGWAGKKAEKARWNEGLHQRRWSLERLWTAAQGEGWRFPMIVSLNRPDQVAEMAERAMIRGGAGIYQIGLELVTVITKEVEGTKGRKTRVAVLDPVTHNGLVAVMGNYVHWHKLSAKGKPVQAAVPGQIVDVILARRGRWGFERINGVIMTPTLRRDGTVLKAEGLDPATGLFLLGPVPVIGQVGDTRADAERAIGVLDGL
jgi:hypothetical protein